MKCLTCADIERAIELEIATFKKLLADLCDDSQAPRKLHKQADRIIGILEGLEAGLRILRQHHA